MYMLKKRENNKYLGEGNRDRERKIDSYIDRHRDRQTDRQGDR